MKPEISLLDQKTHHCESPFLRIPPLDDEDVVFAIHGRFHSRLGLSSRSLRL